MPRFKRDPSELSLIEALDKYSNNPDDPEIQRYKAEIERMGEFFENYQRIAQKLAREFAPKIEFINTKLLPEINRVIANYVSFSKQIEEAVIRINAFSEPLKVLAESIAQRQTPLIYRQVAVLQQHKVISVFEQPTIQLGSSFEAKKELQREEKILDTNLDKLDKINPEDFLNPFSYYEETDTLLIIRTQVIGLNFSSSSGEDNMSVLAKIFLTALRRNGYVRGDYIEVGLTNVQIAEELKKLGLSIISDINRWISNTKNNLLKKIPRIAKDLMIISDYDRTLGGYYLRIKLSPKLPLLDKK